MSCSESKRQPERMRKKICLDEKNLRERKSVWMKKISALFRCGTKCATVSFFFFHSLCYHIAGSISHFNLPAICAHAFCATNCFFLTISSIRAHHIAIFITLSLLMARLIVPEGINISQLSKYCSCLSKTPVF